MDVLKRRKIVVVLVTVVISLLVGFVWARRRFNDGNHDRINVVSVSTIRPVQTNLRRTLEFPGSLESEYSVAVAARVPGILQEVIVEEGQLVEEGEILGWIDPEAYRLEHAAAESEWALAENSLERLTRLYESSGTSRQSLDQARADRDAAYTRYRLAKLRLDYTEIRAPSAGMILQKTADAGNLVSDMSPLFLIGDPGSLRVRTHVPEKYWNDFDKISDIAVFLRRSYRKDAESAEARILRQSPSINPASRTFSLVCIPTEETDWPIGTQLTVEFVLDELNESWILPAETADDSGGLWALDERDSSVRRMEQPDSSGFPGVLVVPESWSDTTFVLHGQNRLVNGQIVEVLRSSS